MPPTPFEVRVREKFNKDFPGIPKFGTSKSVLDWSLSEFKKEVERVRNTIKNEMWIYGESGPHYLVNRDEVLSILDSIGEK